MRPSQRRDIMYFTRRKFIASTAAATTTGMALGDSGSFGAEPALAQGTATTPPDTERYRAVTSTILTNDGVKAPPRIRKPLPRNDQWKAPTPDLEGHRKRLREALGNTLSDEFVDVILHPLQL
jgi:hypothetical protein